MCFFWAYYYPSTGFQLCTEQDARKPDGDSRKKLTPARPVSAITPA
jgi:hypothetical protein